MIEGKTRRRKENNIMEDEAPFIWEPNNPGDESSLDRFIHFTSALAFFMISYVHNIFITIFYNWSTTFFQRPVSRLLSLGMWSVSWVLLLFLALLLRIFTMFGLDKIMKGISEQYYGGASMTNWGLPPLLEKGDEVVEGMDKVGKDKFKKFNVKVAKAMLILASSAYEDRTQWEKFVRSESFQSGSMHITQAAEVGVTGRANFSQIIFFRNRETNNVVISVMFKGTVPTELTEWLTDASFSKIEASDYLWGGAQQGFYTKLFQPLKAGTHNTYGDILLQLKKMVEREGEDVPYTLCVTGHSLGGSLAAVFYARLLKSPEDLAVTGATNIHFAGAYTFGAPRIGNFHLAREVMSANKLPINRLTNYWRVVNANDIFNHIPLGEDNIHTAFITCSGDNSDFLDYCHIGNLAHLHRWSTQARKDPEPQITSWKGLAEWFLGNLPIRENFNYALDFILSWIQMGTHMDLYNYGLSIFPPMGDHMPCRYYDNLGLCKEASYDEVETEIEQSDLKAKK